MIKIIVAFALLCCSLQQLVPISVSSPESTFTEPGHFPTELSKRQFVSGNLLQIAKWIRSTDLNSPNEVSYHTIFKASCEGPATLSITVRDSFKASLNEGPEMKGYGAYLSGYQTKFTVSNYTLNNIRCGENTLVANVSSRGYYKTLIFAIVQDQNSCYKCDNNRSHWDNDICKCTCNNRENCNSLYGPKVWSGYPTCECKCKNVLSCPDNQYFDTKDCVCKCKAVKCYKGYFQDQYSCDCMPWFAKCPNPVDCTGLKVFSQQTCSCRCRTQKVCTYPFGDDSNCGCKCSASIKECFQSSDATSVRTDLVYRLFG